MKFDKQRYPILFRMGSWKQLLHFMTSEFSQSANVDIERFSKNMAPILEQHVKDVTSSKSKPIYVARTIVDHIGNNEKTQKTLMNHSRFIEEGAGVIIIPFVSQRLNALTYTVKVMPEQSGEMAGSKVVTIGGFRKDGLDSFAVLVQHNKDSDLFHIETVTASDIIRSNKTEVLEAYHKQLVDWVFYILLFRQFAEQEVKIIEPGSRAKVKKQKHLNRSPLGVEIMDVNFFTTSVRSEGFEVEGHFRLQACGPGHSKRKLKWIGNYKKNGYTKRSKVSVDDSIEG